MPSRPFESFDRRKELRRQNYCKSIWWTTHLLTTRQFCVSKGEREKSIKNYIEEIRDFQYWKSQEAKYRIRGNIIRLNELGVSALNLSFLDLSNLDLPNVKLNASILSDVDFSFTNLNEAEFVGIFCSGSSFNDKKCFLNKANFTDAHIQHSVHFP